MRNLFIDTNVVIDFLANRKPFSTSALKLFGLSYNNKIKLYISAVSYNNIYYILKQSNSHKDAINLLNELMGMTEVLDVSKAVIENALKSDFKYFEDAIQYYCAKSLDKIDLIITRDTKDFKKSDLPVLTSDEVISLLANEN